MPRNIRHEAIIEIADNPTEAQNAWDMLTEFHRVSKEFQSPHAAAALRAAAWINKLLSKISIPVDPAEWEKGPDVPADS